MAKLRLAILGSTRGTSLQALINAHAKNELQASIEVVISNKPTALILERAKQHGFNSIYIDEQQGGLAFELKLSHLLYQYGIDWLVLIGFMRILSPTFVNTWRNKIINVHPSLLPHGAGLRDLMVHQKILQQRHKISGCSVHLVTEEVDKGPILLQKHCSIAPGETADTLKEKVQFLEGIALVETINQLAAEGW